jgi:hypothetical protein
MLQLDYALLCDYVRAEGGIAHVIAAGIDTINRPEVPTVANFGLFARITFSDEDVGQPHQFEMRLHDQEGEEIAHVTGTQQLRAVEGVPGGWPYGALLALNFGVPLPRFGTYTLTLLLDGEPAKTINLRVVQAEDTAGQAG